jgi:Methyltransferase domain
MVSSQLVRTAKNILPHGLVMKIIRSQAVRRRRIAAVETSAQASKPSGREDYSYSAAIEAHFAKGLHRNHVVAGSISESSLEFCSTTLDKFLHADPDKPLVGLHVGNFVGVSLCHFADYARKRNEDSVVVSIDPNLTHRGIENPQNHVISILNRFGLQRNAMILVGYLGQKSISNDGVTFVGETGEEYDPFSSFSSELSCENVLLNLITVSDGRFDFAILDGNHDRGYLQAEIAKVRRLLKPNGLLLLDDVSEAWADIKKEYDELSSQGWRALGADGRVGILQSN